MVQLIRKAVSAALENLSDVFPPVCSMSNSFDIRRSRLFDVELSSSDFRRLHTSAPDWRLGKGVAQACPARFRLKSYHRTILSDVEHKQGLEVCIHTLKTDSRCAAMYKSKM